MQFNVTESVVAEELCAEDLCSNKVSPSFSPGCLFAKGMHIRALEREKITEKKQLDCIAGSHYYNIVTKAVVHLILQRLQRIFVFFR